ncbi:hypothetical protein B0T22DRAFT_484627 [Podospora appendiculata]|uniref:Uncharacterized protein n=1 Tax=Podospora appendiculata TaxID=314037 RepID=A0AAE0X1P0_9PEZI|nr:hypothetical protein B0T22DRAFT_484627 [Podospora appendiculata]
MTTDRGMSSAQRLSFCSREDVAKELGEALNAVKKRRELNEETCENEQEFQSAIEELTESISRGMDKFGRVWGFDENEIEELGSTAEAETIISMNPDLARRLGITMLLSSSNAEEFAAEVKPFLDSTPNPQGYIAWPVIKEVTMYVKSDILMHGITLIDLPGLSDMVESRSAVAERYFQKLALTTIVTPAIRAVDEKTGNRLMSQYQELRMKLDGKFHKRGFCVVVSKADDMDCDAYCKGPKEAKENPELQADVAEMKEITAQSHEKDKELKAEKRKFESLSRTWIDGEKKLERLRRTQAKIAEQRERQTQLVADRSKQALDVKNIEKSIARIESHRVFLEGPIKYLCMRIRNKYIKERIQADFTKRQSRLLARCTRQYTGSVDMFPVYAQAFREHFKDQKHKPVGFPTKEYTGVTQLRQWLRDSTLEAWKQSLSSTLSTLQRLFHAMKGWSRDNSASTVSFSRQNIEGILESSHTKYKIKLDEELDKGVKEAKKLNPLCNKDKKSMPARQERRLFSRTYLRIDEIWAQFIHEIKTQLEHVASSILPHFSEANITLNNIKMRLLYHIIHICEPHSGKGQFAKRQELILAEPQRRNRQQFLSAYEKMEDRFLRQIAMLPYYFAAVTGDAMTAVKTHIGMLLNNIQTIKIEDQAALSMKIQLQKKVQSLMIAWAAKWRVPQHDSISIEEDAFEIPKCYVEEEAKLGDESDIDVLAEESDNDSD